MKCPSNSSKTCRKWTTVLGLFTIMFPQGIMWYWGNLSVYVHSYVITNVDPTSLVHGPWLMAGFQVAACFGLFLSAFLTNILGKRITTVFGTGVFVGGLFVSYFTLKKSGLAMEIIEGFASGLGLYVTNGVLMIYTVECAKEDFGFVHSIVQSGRTAGAIGLNQIITRYINPDNLSADKKIGPSKYFSQQELLDKVPYVFFILGSSVAICYIAGMLMVKENTNNNEETDELKLDGDNNVVTTYGTTKPEVNNHDAKTETSSGCQIGDLKSDKTKLCENNTESLSDLSPRQILRIKITYIYSVLGLAGCSTYLITTSYYKTYGQLYVHNDHFITNISVALLIVITLSRPCWGRFLDRFGLKTSFIVFFASCGIASMCFYFSPMIDKWCYAFMTLLFTSAGSSSFILVAYACVKTFGKTHCVYNFGLVLLPSSIVIMFISPLFQYFLDEFGWFSIYVSCSLWNLMGLVVSVIALPNKSEKIVMN